MKAFDKLDTYKKKWQSFSYPMFKVHRMAVTFVLFVVILFGVIPGYAYASDKVTIGHVLYPIKKAIENVELQISNDKPEKHLKFSLRRIEEAEAVSGENRTEEKVTQLINDAVQLKNDALKITDENNDDKISAYNEKSIDSLQKMAQKVGVESGDEILNTVALTIDNFTKEKKEIIEKRTEIKIQEKNEKIINKIEMISTSSRSIEVRQNFEQKANEIKNLKKNVEVLELQLNNDLNLL